MKQPTDAIRVGSVTIPYSNRCHGWRLPDGSICHNPILVQQVAEYCNEHKRKR
ncbi:DUF1317 family protein [Pantoea brenneri]|uniref:DUF1317 family protein n=1 Tax=Pantoea brenneri TaxID=472694 RepID=UPI00244B3369|nr:DUF1317 family protein [Pantoea brenneri]MDH2121938.1 DUF1317 family protein [Pantoea brenneri]